MSNVALYGTMSRFGGWSVQFADNGNSTNIVLSGYDKEFPRDRFPDITVYDLRTDESLAAWCSIPDSVKCGGNTLTTAMRLLVAAKKAGVKILY